ncbi:MAG: hypothetical protein ABIQ04_01125 [Candidatus Saccharimonadales bacterium]
MNNELYKPKAIKEISYFVNARQKTYKYSTEIYLPRHPYEKLEDGYELSNRRSSSGIPVPTSAEDKEERSKRRTYTAVKDIALSNVFELFATLTFKEGRDNPDLCKQKMNGWLKRQRKQDKLFQYVIVSEFHKDGVSLHFHALISGYTGKLVRAINPKTDRPLVKGRREVYDVPNYTLGHSEVYEIGETEEDRIKSGFYLLKYIKKDMPSFKNKKRYWSSRGLDKPVTIENPEEWYFAFTPDHMIESEYGKFLFFDNKRIEIFIP